MLEYTFTMNNGGTGKTVRGQLDASTLKAEMDALFGALVSRTEFTQYDYWDIHLKTALSEHRCTLSFAGFSERSDREKLLFIDWENIAAKLLKPYQTYSTWS